MRRSLDDARLLGETLLIIVLTWLVLGWSLVGQTIHQADGSKLVDPLVQSALAAGTDWNDHLYRFGVLGGSKMHEFAGTMPIVQVAAMLGLSTTITANLITLFVQLAFGFFGLEVVLAASTSPRTLPLRVGVVWLCAFAPVLAWRLAWGHENLLLGLLPFVATAAMLWCARTKTTSTFALLFAAFVVCNGVTGLGAQTVIYGAVFGFPIILAIVLDSRPRWGREQWSVLAALLAGVLVALPRLVPMIAHATSDDATRSLGETVTYSYGNPHIRDWIESVPWTHQIAAADGGVALHERNYPIGPLLLFLPLLWHRTRNRWLGWGVLLSTTIAILFSLDVHPISTGLLAAIEPLNAFRVPARSFLPVAALLPPLFAAALLGWDIPASTRARARLFPVVAIAIGLAILLGHRAIGPAVGEVLAWLSCSALLVGLLLRRAHREGVIAAVIVIGALGVVAFGARFPTHLAQDRIEEGPAALRAAVLADSPQLASPLDRVEIADPDPPYAMSLAWAAGLSTLDGVWYPPRRFLVLLNALMDNRYPSTSAVFQLAGTSGFPVLQQLYNVKRLVSLAQGGIIELPETPGAAWFPREITTIDHPSEFAIASRSVDLHATLRDKAWVLRTEASAGLAARCDNARVTNVSVDARGQTATIGVALAQRCTLVVATNFVSTLVATATGTGGAAEVRVFPIDIALVAIDVPAGTTDIVLAPEVRVPLWSRIAQLLGFALLALLVVRAARRASAALATRDEEAADIARTG